jgi:hypothetical protein
MSHRRNELVPPTQSSGSEFVPHPHNWIQTGGKQHTLAVEGVGGPNSDDWIEGLSLCLLCGRIERKKPFTRAARVR